MAGNSFGQLFRVTTFGESHGLALGAVVDGCPPGLEISEADLQGDLDRRKPGTSRYTTPRREPDEVKILSGVFEGKITPTSRICSGRVTLTTPTTRSMVSGTIAAVVAPPPARPRCGWRLVPLPRST